MARQSNNSCSLGQCLYTFGGIDDNDKYLRSIERLDVKRLLEGKAVSWDLIEPDCQAFTPRYNIAVSPVSETEILVMGGSS